MPLARRAVAAPPPGTQGPLGPIQVVPPGLTGLLQLKQLGRQPGQLAETVAPILELRDWYMEARRQITPSLFGGLLTKAGGFTATSTFTPFDTPQLAVVPVGQQWYVDQIVVNCTLAAAADYIRFAIMVQLPNLDIQQVSPDFNDVITARVRTVGTRNDRPFWLGPGYRIGVQVYDLVTASNIPLACALRATPMPIGAGGANL